MDKQTRIFLEQDNSSDSPELEDIPIEEGRRVAEQSIIPSTIQLGSISDIKIPTPEGEIALRIYTPNHGFTSIDALDIGKKAISDIAQFLTK